MTRMPVVAGLVLVALLGAPVAAVGQNDPADAGYREVLAAFKEKEHAKALALAVAFLEAHPDYRHAAAAKYIAGVSAANANEPEAAVVWLRRLLADHPDYKMAAAARDELVTVLSSSRDLDACIAQCEANLEADPTDRRAERWRYMIGECLFRQWRFAEAKAALAKFLADHPGSSLEGRARDYLDRIEPGYELTPENVVRGYAGKYVDDVRFRRAVARLGPLREQAWDRIRERLGVDLRKDAGVIFLFEDAGGDAAGGLRGKTFEVSREGKPATVITFYTEYVVLDPVEYEERVVHEMTHAGFRVAMGQAYLGLPKWVREGLALLAADQADDRIAAILGNAVFSGKSPESLLDGVDDARHDFDDYLEDVLAFEWLAARTEDALPSFCQKLVEGATEREAIEAATGMAYADVIAAMNAHARKRVEEIVGAPGRAFTALRSQLFDAIRAGGEAEWIRGEGGAALRDFFETHPDHPFAPNARYRLGKSLVRTGAPSEGRALLESIVRRDFARTSIADDAAFWAARSFEAEGDPAGARAAYGAFLRDFSWARQVRDVPAGHSAAGPVREVADPRR